MTPLHPTHLLAPPPALAALPSVLLKYAHSSAPIRVKLLSETTFRDLANAAIAGFSLGVLIDDLQLSLVQGKPLSVLEPLDAQGVTSGSVVHVENIVTSELCVPSPPPHTYPLFLTHHLHLYLSSAACEVEAAQGSPHRLCAVLSLSRSFF
jgi:hypothetical protein